MAKSGNWYIDRETLKDSMSLPASATGHHAQLDGAIEAVSRLIDDYVGYPFFTASGVRYYTAENTTALYLDTPLLGVDSVALDIHGTNAFDYAMSSGCYWMTPYNATDESPRQPWWGFELRYNSTAAFPKGLRRATRITGTWGFYNELATLAPTPTAAITATASSIDASNGTAIKSGMTILIDSEQMFVTNSPGNASGTSTSPIIVQRGVNGTVAAAHSSGAAIQVYTYPIIDRATLYQAAQDFRAKDTPLGFAGGDPFGNQRMNSAAGGLHPFVRRMLQPFRTPVVR